MNTIKARPEVA